MMISDIDFEASQKTLNMQMQSKRMYTTSSTTTNNLFSSRELRSPQSSLFGDKDCGEPMPSQHVVIDFTINDFIDNEECQQKCCSFWEFLQKHPELEKLRVTPKPLLEERKEFGRPTSDDMYTHDTMDQTGDHKSGQIPQTAMSMLSFAAGEGIIDRIFETKMCKQYCSSDVPVSYSDHSFNSEQLGSGDEIEVCNCVSLCKCKSGRVINVKLPSRVRVSDLNKELNTWDKQHPKSYEQPRNIASFCSWQTQNL